MTRASGWDDGGREVLRREAARGLLLAVAADAGPAPSRCQTAEKWGSPASLVQGWLSPDGPCAPGATQPACTTRARSKASPARPYICRLMAFSRLTWPSTGPLLHGPVSAAATAASS